MYINKKTLRFLSEGFHYLVYLLSTLNHNFSK